jgi:hypothetical protein
MSSGSVEPKERTLNGAERALLRADILAMNSWTEDESRVRVSMFGNLIFWPFMRTLQVLVELSPRQLSATCSDLV